MRRPPISLVDPDHSAKRAKLTQVGIVLLVLGVPCLVIGIGLFASVFFTSSDEFFARPNQTMDRNSRSAILGMLLMAGGGIATGFGVNLVFFANRGKIARYQAAEITPVASDVIREMAPAVGEAVREVRTAAVSEKPAHKCGTRNDPTDRFCKGCGEPLAGATCPSCRKPNDADARFCDSCGTALD